MAYVPQNIQIFIAAYTGALAGMGVSDRVPTDTVPANYAGLALVAGAWAQAYDTEWGLRATDILCLEATQEMSESVWQMRAPQAVTPNFTPTSYTARAKALIAMITASESYMGSINVTPPAIPGGDDDDSSPFKVIDIGSVDVDLAVSGRQAGAFITTGDTQFDMTGIIVADPTLTQRVVWMGTNTDIITFRNMGATIVPANNIKTPTGADFVLYGAGPTVKITFDYNVSGQYWTMSSIEDDRDYNKLVSGTSVNGVGVSLLDPAGFPLELDSAPSAYLIKASCVASRSNGASRAAFEYTLLVHVSGGVATIDVPANGPNNVALLNGQTWILTFAAVSVGIVATFTGQAGQTIEAVLQYQVTEIRL